LPRKTSRSRASDFVSRQIKRGERERQLVINLFLPHIELTAFFGGDIRALIYLANGILK
jgi:hypothetical protein